MIDKYLIIVGIRHKYVVLYISQHRELSFKI